MTADKNRGNLLKLSFQSFYAKWFNLTQIRSSRFPEIAIGVIILLFSYLIFQQIYNYSPRIANVLLFGVIFVGTFLLVALYHERQILW